MTQKKETAETKSDNVEITLDRDMNVGGEDKKKGSKVTVSKTTATWIKNLPKAEAVKSD